MAVAATTATAAVANGLPNAKVFNPPNIFGIKPSNFGINPRTLAIKPPINPANPNLNATNAANNAGQVATKKSLIASIFSWFSFFPRKSIILTSNLPIKIFFMKSNILSKNPLTGFTSFSAVPINFFNGDFSNSSSAPLRL